MERLRPFRAVVHRECTRALPYALLTTSADGELAQRSLVTTKNKTALITERFFNAVEVPGIEPGSTRFDGTRLQAYLFV